jgi:predicted ester cyclase
MDYIKFLVRLAPQRKEFPMSVEQVASDFIMQMTDAEKTKANLTENAMVSGGILPEPVPAMEALNIISGMKNAMPDLQFDIQEVTVNGNQATVKAQWGGTQTGPLSLPVPGMPAIPPTGKKVSTRDDFIVTVEGDKVSHLHVESPADGGVPAILAQLGVQMPGM